jgi:nitrate/nitrite transporter NarK
MDSDRRLLFASSRWFAVSFPFGAIYGLAGDVTTSEGIALAVVIAAGNVAALVLPAITGGIRDATGEYAGGFVLLGVINAAAVTGVVWLQRKD